MKTADTEVKGLFFFFCFIIVSIDLLFFFLDFLLLTKKPRRKMMPTNQSFDFDRHHHSHLWLFFLASWFRYWMSRSLVRRMSQKTKEKKERKWEDDCYSRDWLKSMIARRRDDFFFFSFFNYIVTSSEKRREWRKKRRKGYFVLLHSWKFFRWFKDTLEKITTKAID